MQEHTCTVFSLQTHPNLIGVRMMLDITSTILSYHPVDISRCTLRDLLALAFAIALIVTLSLYRARRNRRLTPKLTGPPSKSFLFGVTQDIFAAPDLGALYADWERKYGSVYEIPSSLGSTMLVLGDPKGVAHFFANDTTTYQQLGFSRVFIQRFVHFIFPAVQVTRTFCTHKLALLAR